MVQVLSFYMNTCFDIIKVHFCFAFLSLCWHFSLPLLYFPFCDIFPTWRLHILWQKCKIYWRIWTWEGRLCISVHLYVTPHNVNLQRWVGDLILSDISIILPVFWGLTVAMEMVLLAFCVANCSITGILVISLHKHHNMYTSFKKSFLDPHFIIWSSNNCWNMLQFTYIICQFIEDRFCNIYILKHIILPVRNLLVYLVVPWVNSLTDALHYSSFSGIA